MTTGTSAGNDHSPADVQPSAADRSHGASVSGAGTACATVDVHLFAAAAAALGTDGLTARASTVRELLAQLGRDRDDEARRVLARSSVLVGSVARRDHDLPLQEGDRVDVLPPFAGG